MRGHRPFTYVILAINALFLISLIAVAGGAAGDVPDWCHTGEAKYWQGMCYSRRTVVAALIIFGWGSVDAILGVVWLATIGRYKAKKAAETAPAVTSAQ